MLVNINEKIREHIINSYMIIKCKKLDYFEDYLFKIKEENEPLYDAIIMMIAGDAYELLKWLELHQELTDTSIHLIAALEESQNLEMLRVVLEENPDHALGLLLCFLEKNKLKKTTIVEIFNYTMRFQYKQIQKINYFFNYEVVYAILKGYFVKPNFEKKDFINLYHYYEEIDPSPFINNSYVSFIRSIEKYNPRLFERVILEMMEDFYVFTKWMCSNRQFQDLGIFDLKLMDYIETHEFGDSIEYIWNNNKSLRTVIDDFIFYNTAENKVDKEDVMREIQEPETQKILGKINDLKNRMKPYEK